MIHSFQSRIILFFSVLFISVQVLTLATIYQVSQANIIEQVGQRLAYAENIFRRLLADRGDRIVTESRLLVADFGFLSTLTGDHVPTVRSALDNLAVRVKAQRIMLIDLNGRVTADTGLGFESQSFPFKLPAPSDDQKPPRVDLVMLDHALYQLAIVPVRAPEHIAWIAIAMAVNVDVARYFKNLSPSALEITLLEHVEGVHRIILSTLPDEAWAAMGAAADSVATPSPWIRQLAGHRYLTRASTLSTVQADEPVDALLQIDLDTALGPYRVLGIAVAGFFGLGLLATLLGGVVIARRISHPVRMLAAASQRVAEGRFDQPIGAVGKDEFGRLIAAFNNMMEGVAQRERRIAHQLRHDPLTGLPNRRYFEERLQDRLQWHDSCAVILLGLDRYAEISNTLGHDFGDRLVKHIGRMLKDVTPVDSDLARLSTDEFALVVPSPDDQSAYQLLVDMLLQAFERPIALDQFIVDVSARAGITHFPSTGIDVKTLLRNADTALFVARRSFKPYQIYRREDDPCQTSALSLMGELRKGLELGQFALYVQPIVDLSQRRVSHVECLIRWSHPEHGFIPPDRFIAMAEQTGHIHRVTAWVLSEAFRQRLAWKQRGIAVKLAVNLSSKDLLHGRLMEVLDELLVAYPVSASDFMLEITESAVMDDAELAMKSLQIIRQKGFLLGIDDFGTGYSSMAYLKRLPLDELKIDKSFVTELQQNSEDVAIVQSVIDLGHSLGLKIVAEGVETAESFEMLGRFGCDMAQGYWISRPLPCEDFPAWLAESEWSMRPAE